MAHEKAHGINGMATSLTDKDVPLKHRVRMLRHLCNEPTDENSQVIGRLFELAGESNGDALFKKKTQELAAQIEALNAGPLRAAMFLDKLPSDSGQATRRVRATLDDGSVVYPFLLDDALGNSLRRGERILLDGDGKAVVGRDAQGETIGEEARFERRIDDRRVEVVVRDHEPYVFQISAQLAAQLDSSQIEPGSKLLVDSRRRMALDSVPPADGLAHFTFLAREQVPDVVTSRDIACPPLFIDEMSDHVRICMTDRKLISRYKIRQSQTKLLEGVSGSGKSLSILGFWRSMYTVMSDVTGISVDQLPPRVFRLRTSAVYTKWFGDSEKLLARFFSEVEQLADQPIVGADGKQYPGPVLVICEEFDAVARARGTGEPIGERIQATLLERMDVNSPRLKDRMVILLATSNVPQLVDPALLRRAGGTAEHFGRLNRRGCMAVLNKHLSGRQFEASLGSQEEAERRVLRDVTDWLFAQNGDDQGCVEVTYVGSTHPEVKHRRDLMTAALIERGTQDAALEACRDEFHGAAEPGISAAMIVRSLESQLRTLVDQLTPQNVHNYITIPDAARVGSVRRLARPAILPFELERAS
jgi:ATP-dependent 26S proteasome regulatory subunit